jgi:hypothetical protein
MKIKIKEGARDLLPTPYPWYAHHSFEGVVIEVEPSIVEKNGERYFKLRGTMDNFIALRSRQEYLSKRMQERVSHSNIHQCFILVRSVDLMDATNRRASFLLDEEW